MKDQFSVVRHCGSTLEADQIRAFLEANGLEVHIFNENSTRLMSHMLPALGDVQVSVKTEDLETAKALLTAEYPDEKKVIEPEGARSMARRALFAAILGWTVLPVVGTAYSVYVCIQVSRLPVAQKETGVRRQVLLATAVNVLAVVFTAVFLYYGGW